VNAHGLGKDIIVPSCSTKDILKLVLSLECASQKAHHCKCFVCICERKSFLPASVEAHV